MVDWPIRAEIKNIAWVKNLIVFFNLTFGGFNSDLFVRRVSMRMPRWFSSWWRVAATSTAGTTRAGHRCMPLPPAALSRSPSESPPGGGLMTLIRARANSWFVTLLWRVLSGTWLSKAPTSGQSIAKESFLWTWPPRTPWRDFWRSRLRNKVMGSLLMLAIAYVSFLVLHII